MQNATWFKQPFPIIRRLSWPEGASSRKSVKSVKRMPRLRKLILEQGDTSSWPMVDLLCDLIHAMLRYVSGLERIAGFWLEIDVGCAFLAELDSSPLPSSFADGCRYDTEDRMTAQQALAHPFFQLELQSYNSVVSKLSVSLPLPEVSSDANASTNEVENQWC